MKKLLLATATLIALAVPATAMTLVDQVNAVALLAEYVTTCGGRAKPIVEREAVRIVEHIGFKNWYSMASWVHLERDEAVQKQFCLDAAIRSAPMLAASHLTTGKSGRAAEQGDELAPSHGAPLKQGIQSLPHHRLRPQCPAKLIV
jgi:hypothetical protein